MLQLMRRLSLPLLFAFTLLLVLTPVLAFAADQVAAVSPPDWGALAIGLINTAVVVVVPIVTYGVRLILPRIPRFLVPLVAIGLGPVIAWVAALAAGGNVNAITGCLLGAAGVVLREIYSTVKEHGTGA